MKKVNLFLLIVTCLCIFMAACKKETAINKSANVVDLSTARINENEMENAMNHFITQSYEASPVYGSPQYEDALLMKEGCLNYRLCKPDTNGGDTRMDTIYKTVTITQGATEYYIAQQDLTTLFSSLYQNVDNAITRVNIPGSTLNYREWCDLEFVEFATSNATTSTLGNAATQTATIRAITKVIDISQLPCDMHCGYVFPDDYWSILGGGCNWNTCPLNPYLTCSRVVEKHFNQASKLCKNVQSDVVAYYGNVQIINFQAAAYNNYNDPIPGDGILEKLMFDGLQTPYSCIPPADMEFYHQNMVSIANNSPLKPIKTVAFSFLYNMLVPQGFPNYTSSCNVSYGRVYKYSPN